MPEPTEYSQSRKEIARLCQLRKRILSEIETYNQLGDNLSWLHAVLLEQVLTELEALIEKLTEAAEQDQDHHDPAMQALISQMEIQVQSDAAESVLEKLKFPAPQETDNNSKNEK